MNSTTELPITKLVLPSDQDASGRTLGLEEVEAVAEAIRSGTLTSTKGEFVKTFERRFSHMLGVKHAYACSSGTAAIHCAIAALDPEPGDEFITSAITDMGALTPILYQGAIPVFAEVDRHNLCVTAETIAPHINERTKGIIVTHLFGHACEMEKIVKLAQDHRIPVIEDCAQSFLAERHGKYTGTWGEIGCFSTQQGKHITTGEGGLVTTNNPVLARRMFLFINKAWGYGDPNPDHYFLALNYRMTELQGAVAVAQLEKLSDVVERRARAAEYLSEQLRGLPGISVPRVEAGDTHSFWKYILNVNSEVIAGGAVALARKLREEHGISSAPRYIQKPAFDCEIFRKQKTFGSSRFPFSIARPEAVCYPSELYPETYAALEQVLVLPWNEKYETCHLDFIASAIREGATNLCTRS
jgi:dTDP-4-amino-4,6-dideoxygalactose transaminase